MSHPPLVFFYQDLPDITYEPSIPDLMPHCPTLADKFWSALHATKAPVPMIIQSGLAVCSYLLQNLVQVQLPYGDTKPCGLYLLTVAESGERKSGIEKYYFKAIKELEEEYRQKHQEQSECFEIANHVWAEQKKQLLKAAVREPTETTSESPDSPSAIEALYKHEKNKPKRRPLALKTFEDTTTEALLNSIHTEQVQSVMLRSSEGDTMLSGHAARKLSVWNKLWDCDSIELDRKKEGKKSITVPTTLFIQVQPGAFQRFSEKKDGQAMDLGFLPRAIFSFPQSTQGTRFEAPKKPLADHCAGPDPDKLFDDVVKNLFRANIEASENPGHQPQILSFDNIATGNWYIIANEIEARTQPNGPYAHVKGHASKLMENISRVAAILHAVEHGIEKTQISRDTLITATNLCIGFSNHFIRYFTKEPEDMADYRQLLDWLNRMSTHHRYLLKNYIRQYGPNCIRSKGKLDVLLEIMQGNGLINQIKHKKKLIVDLFPSYLDNMRLLDYIAQNPQENLPPPEQSAIEGEVINQNELI